MYWIVFQVCYSDIMTKNNIWIIINLQKRAFFSRCSVIVFMVRSVWCPDGLRLNRALWLAPPEPRGALWHPAAVGELVSAAASATEARWDPKSDHEFAPESAEGGGAKTVAEPLTCRRRCCCFIDCFLFHSESNYMSVNVHKFLLTLPGF